MKGYTPSKRRRRSPLADTQELWLFAPCASNRFGALTHFSLIFSVWAHPKLAARANNLKPRGRVKQRLRQLERRKKHTFGGSWVNYIVQSAAVELLTKRRGEPLGDGPLGDGPLGDGPLSDTCMVRPGDYSEKTLERAMNECPNWSGARTGWQSTARYRKD